MKKINFIYYLFAILLLFSCSIDRKEEVLVIEGIDGVDGKDGRTPSFESFVMDNGTLNIFFIDAEPVNSVFEEGEEVIGTFFVENGKDGKDGQDGIDGVDGIDGIDGVDGISSSVQIYEAEGGYFIHIITDNQETVEFIRDGTDGQDGTNGTDGVDGADGYNGVDGLNGIDGINGEDGTNVTVRTEEVDGGTLLYITDVNGTVVVFIEDGIDGTDGENGTNGQNGEDGTNGTDGQDGTDGEDGVCEACTSETVTICHNGETTMILTFSEYVDHVYDEHGGDCSEDSLGECPEYEVRLAVKDPQNRFGTGEAGRQYGQYCHYNYSTVVAHSEQEYIWYTQGGGSGIFAIPYPSRTFELPDGKIADDYDCDSSPNL